jgi:uncharacterized protein YdeI (YjbR/CyaY-like superfamily)
MNKDVNNYFINGCDRCKLYATPQCKVHTWQAELHLLRSILQNTTLVETCKWGVPCYMHNGKNLLMLSAFKQYASISFFNGYELMAQHPILEPIGPNAQQGAQLRVTSIQQIKKCMPQINAAIDASIKLQNHLATKPKPVAAKPSLPLPEELIEVFTQDNQVKQAFEALTPGRQKGFLIHFNGAKQSTTRLSRINKCIPLILKGKGMHD